MGSKNSTNISSVLPRPAPRRIQNFLLVWLDANTDESTPDFKNSLTKLRRIVASIETYNDSQECIELLQQVKDQKVFIIVSGALGQKVVPEIHEWDQIDSIYVFCGNALFHEKWSSKYCKVKGVYTDIEPICKALEIDRQGCDQMTITVSFQSDDPLFMYTQLVKEAILQIDYDETGCIKELAAFCRQKGDINEDEIQDVEKNYKKHTPVWWYTAPAFMNSMLNRGLRTFDVDILMKMGFFLSQLDRHIRELSKQQCADPKGLKIIGKPRFEVYRGQGLSAENFEKLKQCKGGLMSFNNLLSTSCDKNVSLQNFARPAAFSTGYVAILFVMQIDTDLCKTADIPFLEITGKIGFYEDGEAEVLFTTHTLFRIENIQQITDPHTDRLYQVDLRMASPETYGLKEVADSLNKNIGDRKGLARLAYILRSTRLSEQAKEIYHALLEIASTDDDIAEYSYQLGWVYDDLGEYKKAIQYYEAYYNIKRETLPVDHTDLAWYYSNTGLVYCKMGDYSKALSSC